VKRDEKEKMMVELFREEEQLLVFHSIILALENDHGVTLP
jgi:hypothetical protein